MPEKSGVQEHLWRLGDEVIGKTKSAVRCRVMALAAFVAFSAPTRAQELAHMTTHSGKDLASGCHSLAQGETPSAATNLEAVLCMGEIEALAWMAPGLKSRTLRACLPEGVTSTQTAKTVSNFLDHNPDRLNEPFEALALEAFADMWPCPPTKEKGWIARLAERLFGDE